MTERQNALRRKRLLAMNEELDAVAHHVKSRGIKLHGPFPNPCGNAYMLTVGRLDFVLTAGVDGAESRQFLEAVAWRSVDGTGPGVEKLGSRLVSRHYATRPDGAADRFLAFVGEAVVTEAQADAV